jgi:hypothetical protein
MAQFEELTVGKLTMTGGGAIGTVAAVDGLSVKHKQMGVLVQSTFTLTDVAQAVVNGTEYQGTKLFDFPEGFIKVEGVVASLAQKTTSALASTINAGVTGAVSLGTATASNVSLTSTMVDLLPSTAFTSSATINVAGTAVVAGLAASAIFDGHSTAKSMFLNSAYATTTDVDGNGTQTFTGTIIVTWLALGDA